MLIPFVPFRPKNYTRAEGVARIDILATQPLRSLKNFKDIMEAKSTRVSTHPFELAESFYKTQSLKV